TAGGLLVAYALYGVVLVVAYRLMTRRGPSPALAAGSSASTNLAADTATTAVPVGTPVARRAVLAAAVGGALAVPSYALITRLYDQAVFSYDGLAYSGPSVMPIAPNDKFYAVTKNVVDPDVDRGWWGLEIGGLVEHPQRYDFAELAALPSTD